jgi:baseplate upper protein BppU
MHMMKTFAFTLDLEKPETLATKITVAIADFDTIEFTINLTQDGAPFDLTGKDVILLTKVIGAVKATDCVVRDGPLGVLSVILPTEAYNKIGTFVAELAIMEGVLQRAIPNQFNYSVRASLFTDLATEAGNPLQAVHERIFSRLDGGTI